jgi:hypothetical protein
MDIGLPFQRGSQPQLTPPINHRSPPPSTTDHPPPSTAVNPNHYLTTTETPTNHPPVEKQETIYEIKPTAEQQEKTRILAGLQNSQPIQDHTGLNNLDLDKYPVDVQPVIGKVCQLWKLRPPVGKNKSYWIESGRELMDACSEFGPALLEKVRKDFEDYMAGHHGLPPFTVEGPGSLVKTARAAAGTERNKLENGPEPDGDSISQDDFFERPARRR